MNARGVWLGLFAATVAAVIGGVVACGGSHHGSAFGDDAGAPVDGSLVDGPGGRVDGGPEGAGGGTVHVTPGVPQVSFEPPLLPLLETTPPPLPLDETTPPLPLELTPPDPPPLAPPPLLDPVPASPPASFPPEHAAGARAPIEESTTKHEAKRERMAYRSTAPDVRRRLRPRRSCSSPRASSRRARTRSRGP